MSIGARKSLNVETRHAASEKIAFLTKSSGLPTHKAPEARQKLAQHVAEFRSAERGISAGYTEKRTTSLLPQAGAERQKDKRHPERSRSECDDAVERSMHFVLNAPKNWDLKKCERISATQKSAPVAPEIQLHDTPAPEARHELAQSVPEFRNAERRISAG
jgi:hypothetical protein